MTVGGLLLAGGSGTRFGHPKQFLQLVPGIRLVDAALATVHAVADEVVLVLPTDEVWSGAAVDHVVAGGDSRLASVRAGVAVLSESHRVILVHDAAHPLASIETAAAVVSAVDEGADAAVPWLPVVDVLKRLRADGSLETAGRDGLGQAQTPHAFRGEVLRELHARATTKAWEDTQLVERQGGRVVGVAGDAANIHVVTADDLDVARRLAATAHREPTRKSR
jgi:2-C-methyl-D-erythritol 4-phosphate cytidylyltransferase